jgi:hypothetical protein
VDEWKVDYDNDTGPNDDYLVEWWTVSNGAHSFRAGSESDAVWLAALLNNLPPEQRL